SPLLTGTVLPGAGEGPGRPAPATLGERLWALQGTLTGGGVMPSGAAVTRVTAPGPGRLRSFDPVRVGRLEAAVWAAYYHRQWARFLALAVWLTRSAFGMDWT